MDITPISVGRIVHFYPNAVDEIARQNGAEFVPAIVVQTWEGDMANLKIFPFGSYEPGEDLRGSVHHKDSEYVTGFEPGSIPYWVYPPKV